MSDIEKIKQKVGQEAENIIANGLNLIKQGQKYRCVNKAFHKHNDKDPSMSWDKQALQFYCFACNTKIDIYGYYREYLNYTHEEVVNELLGATSYKETSMQKKRNNFIEEVKKIVPINSECINYIASRGINIDTAKAFKIQCYKGAIAFPYYKNNVIIGYKVRKAEHNPPKPKMTNIQGSKPYLFNSQNIDINKQELIICEGEFDCMILHQCGYENVVSVGAGANSLNTMLKQAHEFLNNFKSLIIVSDNDVAGQEMDKTFLEIFKNKAKIIDKKLYTLNDVNDEYLTYGKDKIDELIDSARFKIEGRRDLTKEPYRGLKKNQGKYIPTGIKTIDNALNDLAPKCVTLITGRSNGGKTTFVKQIIANAINKNNKVYLINGENETELLINELYQVVIGANPKYYDEIKINKKVRKEPKPEILSKLLQWHRDKLCIFNKGDSKLKTNDELIAMLEQELQYNQPDLIVIDNLMSVISAKSNEKYEQQADFMQKLCDMAKTYNTHIILVLHPNKTYSKGSDMEMEQISGNSDLYNKSDNIIAVIREYDKEKHNKGIHGYIQVLKNRYYEDIVKANIYYDKETRLLLENDGVDILEYDFDIEKNNQTDMQGVKNFQEPFNI